MRILVTTPWTGFWEVGTGGGVPDEYLTFQALVRRGHQLHVVAPHGARYALPDEGPGELLLHTVPFPGRRLRGRWRGQLGRIWDLIAARYAFGTKLARVSNSLDPDLFLAHSFHTAPWAARVARARGRPIVAKFFGVLELNTAWEPRFIHFLKHFEHYVAFKQPYDRVIVLDDGTGGDQAARRLGVQDDRLLFWPNGVDLDWGDATLPAGGGDRASRRAWSLPATGVLTLTLCNLLPLKRVERVIEAVASVDEVTAVIGGDGVQRRALERLVERLAIGERVIFLGAIDHDRVPGLMRAVDIYVAAHDLTNAGLPTCEAMLCGLPVVALDVGATRRLVKDGETGIVVPPAADVPGLATAIRRLAHDSDLRRRLGERGRAQARQSLVSWDERIRMEVELLETIGARAATPVAPPPEVH